MNRKLLEDLKTTGYTPEIVKHEAISMIEGQEKEIIRLNNIINELEKWLNHSIESINEKLIEDKKETIFKNGICQNLNDYQILRLKTFRTKMNEVLNKLNELKENK